MTDPGPTTFEIFADIAQVVIGLAAIVSIWIGVASLREARRERGERIRPRLAFDHGGQVVPCEDKQAVGVPGMNPAYIESVVGAKQRDVRRPTNPGGWGRLRNHGGGVALSVRVTFVTREAKIGREIFHIDQQKLNSFPYQLDVNQLPSSPTHIHPGEEGIFMRIPTPLYEREGNRELINGVAVIACRDVLDRAHFRFQEFRCRVEHRPAHYGVLLTFGDELEASEAREVLGELSAGTPGLGSGMSARARLLRELVRTVPIRWSL